MTHSNATAAIECVMAVTLQIPESRERKLKGFLTRKVGQPVCYRITSHSSRRRCLLLAAIGFFHFLLPICSSAKDFRVVSNEYAGQTFKKATLAVAPLVNLAIKNPNDLERALGKGDSQEVFLKFLEANLPELLRAQSVLSDVRFATYKGDPALERTPLTSNSRERIDIQLPRFGKAAQLESFNAEFILFLSNFTVSRDSDIFPPAFDKSPILRYTTEFAVWDNGAGKVVSYGRATAEDVFRSRTSKAHWNGALGKLAKSFVEKSPFAIR
jgi:hypothetical protein